ncbi:hypothetical protein GCM10008090_29080 [Arenicella chitinivorans]|uniref:Uncharacterized protein n=1 Tax=Arenicella chitinivorans TaxID=1329800 RepID=A0A918VRS9_9GAMM|nr:hypothetical protein GCM10008090_29080 [Arenicella chitinivorans]
MAIAPAAKIPNLLRKIGLLDMGRFHSKLLLLWGDNCKQLDMKLRFMSVNNNLQMSQLRDSQT